MKYFKLVVVLVVCISIQEHEAAKTTSSDKPSVGSSNTEKDKDGSAAIKSDSKSGLKRKDDKDGSVKTKLDSETSSSSAKKKKSETETKKSDSKSSASSSKKDKERDESKTKKSTSKSSASSSKDKKERGESKTKTSGSKSSLSSSKKDKEHNETKKSGSKSSSASSKHKKEGDESKTKKSTSKPSESSSKKSTGSKSIKTAKSDSKSDKNQKSEKLTKKPSGDGTLSQIKNSSSNSTVKKNKTRKKVRLSKDGDKAKNGTSSTGKSKRQKDNKTKPSGDKKDKVKIEEIEGNTTAEATHYIFNAGGQKVNLWKNPAGNYRVLDINEAGIVYRSGKKKYFLDREHHKVFIAPRNNSHYYIKANSSSGIRFVHLHKEEGTPTGADYSKVVPEVTYIVEDSMKRKCLYTNSDRKLYLQLEESGRYVLDIIGNVDHYLKKDTQGRLHIDTLDGGKAYFEKDKKNRFLLFSNKVSVKKEEDYIQYLNFLGIKRSKKLLKGSQASLQDGSGNKTTNASKTDEPRHSSLTYLIFNDEVYSETNYFVLYNCFERLYVNEENNFYVLDKITNTLTPADEDDDVFFHLPNNRRKYKILGTLNSLLTTKLIKPSIYFKKTNLYYSVGKPAKHVPIYRGKNNKLYFVHKETLRQIPGKHSVFARTKEGRYVKFSAYRDFQRLIYLKRTLSCEPTRYVKMDLFMLYEDKRYVRIYRGSDNRYYIVPDKKTKKRKLAKISVSTYIVKSQKKFELVGRLGEVTRGLFEDPSETSNKEMTSLLELVEELHIQDVYEKTFYRVFVDEFALVPVYHKNRKFYIPEGGSNDRQFRLLDKQDIIIKEHDENNFEEIGELQDVSSAVEDETSVGLNYHTGETILEDDYERTDHYVKHEDEYLPLYKLGDHLYYFTKHGAMIRRVCKVSNHKKYKRGDKGEYTYDEPSHEGSDEYDEIEYDEIEYDDEESEEESFESYESYEDDDYYESDEYESYEDEPESYEYEDDYTEETEESYETTDETYETEEYESSSESYETSEEDSSSYETSEEDSDESYETSYEDSSSSESSEEYETDESRGRDKTKKRPPKYDSSEEYDSSSYESDTSESVESREKSVFKLPQGRPGGESSEPDSDEETTKKKGSSIKVDLDKPSRKPGKPDTEASDEPDVSKTKGTNLMVDLERPKRDPDVPEEDSEEEDSTSKTKSSSLMVVLQSPGRPDEKKQLDKPPVLSRYYALVDDLFYPVYIAADGSFLIEKKRNRNEIIYHKIGDDTPIYEVKDDNTLYRVGLLKDVKGKIVPDNKPRFTSSLYIVLDNGKPKPVFEQGKDYYSIGNVKGRSVFIKLPADEQMYLKNKNGKVIPVRKTEKQFWMSPHFIFPNENLFVPVIRSNDELFYVSGETGSTVLNKIVQKEKVYHRLSDEVFEEMGEAEQVIKSILSLEKGDPIENINTIKGDFHKTEFLFKSDGKDYPLYRSSKGLFYIERSGKKLSFVIPKHTSSVFLNLSGDLQVEVDDAGKDNKNLYHRTKYYLFLKEKAFVPMYTYKGRPYIYIMHKDVKGFVKVLLDEKIFIKEGANLFLELGTMNNVSFFSLGEIKGKDEPEKENSVVQSYELTQYYVKLGEEYVQCYSSENNLYHIERRDRHVHLLQLPAGSVLYLRRLNGAFVLLEYDRDGEAPGPTKGAGDKHKSTHKTDRLKKYQKTRYFAQGDDGAINRVYRSVDVYYQEIKEHGITGYVEIKPTDKIYLKEKTGMHKYIGDFESIKSTIFADSYDDEDDTSSIHLGKKTYVLTDYFFKVRNIESLPVYYANSSFYYITKDFRGKQQAHKLPEDGILYRKDGEKYVQLGTVSEYLLKYMMDSTKKIELRPIPYYALVSPDKYVTLQMSGRELFYIIEEKGMKHIRRPKGSDPIYYKHTSGAKLLLGTFSEISKDLIDKLTGVEQRDCLPSEYFAKSGDTYKLIYRNPKGIFYKYDDQRNFVKLTEDEMFYKKDGNGSYKACGKLQSKLDDITSFEVFTSSVVLRYDNPLKSGTPATTNTQVYVVYKESEVPVVLIFKDTITIGDQLDTLVKYLKARKNKETELSTKISPADMIIGSSISGVIRHLIYSNYPSEAKKQDFLTKLKLKTICGQKTIEGLPNTADIDPGKEFTRLPIKRATSYMKALDNYDGLPPIYFLSSENFYSIVFKNDEEKKLKIVLQDGSSQTLSSGLDKDIFIKVDKFLVKVGTLKDLLDDSIYKKFGLPDPKSLDKNASQKDKYELFYSVLTAKIPKPNSPRKFIRLASFALVKNGNQTKFLLFDPARKLSEQEIRDILNKNLFNVNYLLSGDADTIIIDNSFPKSLMKLFTRDSILDKKTTKKQDVLIITSQKKVIQLADVNPMTHFTRLPLKVRGTIIELAESIPSDLLAALKTDAEREGILQKMRSELKVTDGELPPYKTSLEVNYVYPNNPQKKEKLMTNLFIDFKNPKFPKFTVINKPNEVEVKPYDMTPATTTNGALETIKITDLLNSMFEKSSAEEETVYYINQCKLQISFKEQSTDNAAIRKPEADAKDGEEFLEWIEQNEVHTLRDKIKFFEAFQKGMIKYRGKVNTVGNGMVKSMITYYEGVTRTKRF